MGKRDGNGQCRSDLVRIQNKRHLGVVLRILQIHLPEKRKILIVITHLAVGWEPELTEKEEASLTEGALCP